MKGLLGQLLQSPTMLLLTLGVAGLTLVWLLRKRLRAAGQAATYADPQATDGLALEVADYESGGKQPVKVMDLRSSGREAALEKSFRRAMQLIERSADGSNRRYQKPWFLSVGQVSAGKTTLLRHTRQQLPYGLPEEGETPPCTWWFFERALVLDISGDLVLRREDASSDQPAWLELLRLLRQHRPRRPIDGILLTIPVSELYGVESSDTAVIERVVQRAEVLRRKLEQAQARLRMQVPVYLVVSKCDRLPGFSDFSDALEEAQKRDIFGWSQDGLPEDSAYSGAMVDAAVGSIVQSLENRQVEALGQVTESGDVRQLVALPAVFDSMRETLRIVLGKIFAQAPGQTPLALRGLYFVGGEGFEEVDNGLHMLPESLQSVARPAPSPAHQRVNFVADLFHHKTFYEWNLGRPAPLAVARLDRWLRLAKSWLLILLLIGPIPVWWSGRQVERDAQRLEDLFLRPSLEAFSATGGASPLQAAELLEAMNRLPDYRLRSIFLPASWWSSYGRRVTDAVTGTFDRIFFPRLAEQLDLSLDSVPSTFSEPRPSPQILDIKTVPEFQNLRQSMRRLDQIERDLDLYNCFAPVQCTPQKSILLRDFVRLVRNVQGVALRPPTGTAERFLGRVLGQSQPLRRQLTDPGIEDRVLARSRQMYHRLYRENLVSLDLADLASGIQALGGVAHEDDAATLVYRRLVATIDQTEKDLARPELAWAASPDLALGGAYDELLRSMISARILGLSFAKKVRREGEDGDAGYEGFRQSLTMASSDLTGPLLARENTVVQLKLSPEVLGLRAVLKALLDQRFMRLQPRRELQLEPEEGTYLRWDGTKLTEAAALYEAYNSFVSKSFEGYDGLRQAIENGVRDQLEQNVLGLLAEAQLFPQRPPTFTRQLGEDLLRNQVTNLTEASDSLNLLFTQLEKPATGSRCAHSVVGAVHCQLTAVLTNQKSALLDEADALRVEARLYAPNEDAFSDWNGRSNLAWDAFGVTDAKGLEDYLKEQWQVAQTLGVELAEPTLTLVPTQDYWDIEQGELFKRWRLFINDLAQFDAKEPQNPIASLEQFIGEDMAKTRLGNCLELQPVDACFAISTPRGLTTGSVPCDEFVGAQEHLQNETARSCRAATWSVGSVAYGKVQDSFEVTLKDKFPFVALPAPQPRADASAEDLSNFFKVFDQQRQRITRLLTSAERNPSQRPGDRRAIREVGEFMTKMGEVRDFFGAFLEDRRQNPAALPVFDVDVEFRVNRDFEERGEEIIRWRFEIGDQLVALDPQLFDENPPEDGKSKPGRWTCGQPLRLSLQWARDGLTSPVAADNDSNARVEDRTLTFEYQDPWALFSLLRERRAAADDLPNRIDPNPRTLALEAGIIEPLKVNFRVATEAASASRVPKERKKGEGIIDVPQKPSAKVFVRLVLRRADDTQAELSLPEFPVQPPNLPESPRSLDIAQLLTGSSRLSAEQITANR